MKKLNAPLSLILLSILLSACNGKQPAPAMPPTPPTAGYDDPHRPQFHFSPATGWMNDPNGMVFYEGEYHLFYQFYPDSTVWGPMHWAHAVSKDMVRWEHLPVALYPDSLGYIFSGSAVVDWNNTSGFAKDGKPPLVAIYTYHDMAGEKAGRKNYQSQAIAYSNDRGRSWTKYAGNPVIPNTHNLPDIRDPKVIWHEDSKQWVMALAVRDHLQIWGSKDLKTWEHLSDFGKEQGTHKGVWECPDLFPMSVEGTSKWVLLQNINPGGPTGGSGTQYFVGHFDGKNFTLDPDFAPSVRNEKAVWLDHGSDNYAGVTWSDIPKSDGRRLFLGWMSNWNYATVVPTKLWRSAMTLPRSLELKQTPAGYRVFSLPAKELETLRAQTFNLEKTALEGSLDLTDKLGFSPTLSEIELEVELPENASGEFGIEVSNSKNERYRVGYDASKKAFFSDREQAGDASFSKKFRTGIHYAPRFVEGKTLRLQLFLDAASVELFGDNGAVVMTDIFFPQEDFNRLKIFSEGGKVQINKGSFYKLRSIWR
ncbi:MAG: glycoside hydrolase family 32 protein [Saprospiraceae bacterium]|nr:glycoside hydrolase family 32 protein [Saprospiraceae bacterium]